MGPNLSDRNQIIYNTLVPKSIVYLEGWWRRHIIYIFKIEMSSQLEKELKRLMVKNEAIRSILYKSTHIE